MSFLDKLSALVPFAKKEEVLEYFFALNIANEKLTASLWTVENKNLKILEQASQEYSSLDDLVPVTDKLLDKVLGIRELEVSKILFGVPSSWLTDENLKEDNLKILRNLVKELELEPLAYVETAHALVHFLEKTDGIPPTAVLVGFEQNHLTVTVVRAGKLDGVKVVTRGDSSGAGIEKALLTFTNVETLPSKILIYGPETAELKSQLLSYAWMSKLSFLHFPKIEILPEEIEIKSVCLAGASEIKGEVHYKVTAFAAEEAIEEEPEAVENLGFVVGDIAGKKQEEGPFESTDLQVPFEESELALPEETVSVPENKLSTRRFLPKLPKSPIKLAILFGVIGTLSLILIAYLFLLKAEVKVFVEPKILEKETQVTADPKQKTVDEEAKIIPGQIVETDVSGSSKAAASGKKQIGDPAKGTVIIRNKTDGGIPLSKGTILTAQNGLKFTLDLSASAAARSAEDGTWSKTTVTVTATSVGADGNLASGTDLTVSGYSSERLIAKAEGNFSGGTSKDVTVVSDDDQKKLLASLASDLRKQARQKLQDQLPGKKILEEALSEDNVKKSYSKHINDQASEFSLNLTIHYKGTAFEDKDLKLIVSKLVTTQVPEGFELNLEGTETQADVSKLENMGKLIFLAKFKAKLLPKLNKDELVNKIKGKSAKEAENTLKGMDSILGLEIKLTPSLPPILQRLPLLSKNIKLEVGLK